MSLNQCEYNSSAQCTSPHRCESCLAYNPDVKRLREEVDRYKAERDEMTKGIGEIFELWEKFRAYDNVLPYELMDIEELELLNQITAAITRIQGGGQMSEINEKTMAEIRAEYFRREAEKERNVKTDNAPIKFTRYVTDLEKVTADRAYWKRRAEAAEMYIMVRNDSGASIDTINGVYRDWQSIKNKDGRDGHKNG